jgi:hypothetical protein
VEQFPRGLIIALVVGVTSSATLLWYPLIKYSVLYWVMK